MAKQSTSSKDKYTDPKLREEVKMGVKKSGKGGRPGQWTARKAQMMAKEYEKKGGDYTGEKDESQKHIQNWDDDPEKERKNEEKNEENEEKSEKRGRLTKEPDREEPPKKEAKAKKKPTAKPGQSNLAHQETKPGRPKQSTKRAEAK